MMPPVINDDLKNLIKVGIVMFVVLGISIGFILAKLVL
jgi:hypothetical protein